MDPRLLQYINHYLFGKGDNRSQTVELERFAELFVYCTRGTVDEKLKVLLISLGKTDMESADIPYILVKEVSFVYVSQLKVISLIGYNCQLTIKEIKIDIFYYTYFVFIIVGI